MHEKIQATRKNNGLTISEFLKECGIPVDDSYCKQLCSKGGSKMHPSNRPGSKGKSFRNTMKSFLTSSVSRVDISSLFLEDIIEDWVMDNCQTLDGMGIATIRLDPKSFRLSKAVSNPQETIEILLTVVVFDQCESSNEEIVALLLDDDVIKDKVAELSASFLVKRSRSELLSILRSPMCLTAERVGTGTTLNYRGAIFTLTARHVIGATSETKSVGRGVFDNFSKKYVREGEISDVFGQSFVHECIDVGVVFPFNKHPLVVNYIDDINLPINMFNWWKGMTSAGKYHFLSSDIVLKHGISSGVTTGEVMDASMCQDSFWVCGKQVTPFAVPGDSGALVVNRKGVVLGIVKMIALSQSNSGDYVTEVIPIWCFFDWLDEAWEVKWQQNEDNQNEDIKVENVLSETVTDGLPEVV
jgi:hypothetical protein